MIKVKLITYIVSDIKWYTDEEEYTTIVSLKEFQDLFNTIKRKGLDGVDRIEFIVE